MMGNIFSFSQKMFDENEEGSVMVEFVLMLPLVIILMLFLLICYDLVGTQINLQVAAWADLRQECTQINSLSGHFVMPRKVTASKHKSVLIGGKMGSIVGLSQVPLKAEISTYAGSMRGKGGVSKYYNSFGDRYYWF